MCIRDRYSFGINMLNADVYAKVNLTKKTFLEVAARKSYTEFLQSPTYNEYFKKAFQNTSIIDFTNQNKIICSTDKNFSFNDISAKIVQKIGEKNIFAVDFITIEDQLDVTQEDESTEEEIATKNTVYQRNFGTSFTWKSNWNAKNSLLFNVSNSQYELDSKTTNLEDIYGYKKQENYVYDNLSLIHIL